MESNAGVIAPPAPPPRLLNSTCTSGWPGQGMARAACFWAEQRRSRLGWTPPPPLASAKCLLPTLPGSSIQMCLFYYRRLKRDESFSLFYLAILSATTSVLSGYYYRGGLSVWGQ